MMQFIGNINSALSAYLSDWFCHAWDYITGQYELVLHSESEYVNGYSEDDIEALRRTGLSEDDIAEIVGIGVEKDNASVVEYTESGNATQPTSDEKTSVSESVVIPSNPDEKTRVDYELTYYVNDVNKVNTQVLMEYGKRDELKSVYTYGNERISAETIADTYNAVTDDFETDYYLYDGRGSVAQVVSGDEIVESYTYDPFGNVTSGAPDFDSFYGYNGEDTNLVTGLQYLRFRYYDTEDGRFNVLDTYLGDVSEPLTLNRYVYTANNPVMHIDPSGHFILTALVVGAVIGAGIGAVSSGVKSYNNQKANGGKVDGWTVAKDALVGGVVGGLVGAAAGVVGAAAAAAVTAVAGTGLAATMVAGAVGGVAGGIVSRGTNTILTGTASNIIQKNNLYKSAVYTQQKTPQQILDEAVGNAFDVKAMVTDAMLGAAIAGGGYAIKNLVSKLQAVRQHSCGSAPEIGAQSVLDDVTPKVPDVVDDAANQLDGIVENTAEATGKVDFYVKPSGEVVPSTGYRYMSRDANYISTLEKTMEIPANNNGTYITFDKFDVPAPEVLQVPHDASIRGTFDTLQIIDDIKTPNGKWGEASWLEPITRDFPEYGLGGATQAVTTQKITLDSLDDLLK